MVRKMMNWASILIEKGERHVQEADPLSMEALMDRKFYGHTNGGDKQRSREACCLEDERNEGKEQPDREDILFGKHNTEEEEEERQNEEKDDQYKGMKVGRKEMQKERGRQ